jgi:hypothetical protein
MAKTTAASSTTRQRRKAVDFQGRADDMLEPLAT